MSPACGIGSACLDVESGGVSFTGDAEQGGETQTYDALRNTIEENQEYLKTPENYRNDITNWQVESMDITGGKKLLAVTTPSAS